MRRYAATLVLALFVAMPALASGEKEATDGGQQEGQDGEPRTVSVDITGVEEYRSLGPDAPSGEDLPDTVTVGLSWNEKTQSLVEAWEDYMKQYSERYAEMTGTSFEWVVNVAGGDPTQQNSNIEDLITQDVDVIVARAEDGNAIGSGIRAAKQAGIPFMTFDRQSANVQPNAHVGADSFAQGLRASRELADLLEERGIEGRAIELIGDLRDVNAVNRHEAFEQVEEERGAWTTVAEVPTEWEPSKFRTGLADALSANPDANVLYVASDFAFDAVENALSQHDKLQPAGEEGHMWTASNDLNPAGLEAMENGYIDIAVTYDAYYHAIQAVKIIGRLAAGQELNGTKYLVAGRLATPDNLDDMEFLWSREYSE
jgi:ABC-type sugar transport system substrate-binding protein